MSTILGIESTCDETGAAVVVDGVDVRSNIVASQVSLHEKYRGVVPEIASRAHIENVLPVVREALSSAGCAMDELDAITVAHRPGLIGSLLIGVTAAKTLAWSLKKPLIGVDHVHAHLYSVMLNGTPLPAGEGLGVGRNYVVQRLSPPAAPPVRRAEKEPVFPAVGLVVSGGHTALYRIDSWTDIALIGSTIDDAVGEAYDKVAAILGLGYPGGPIIDRLAGEGSATIRFPRSLLGRDSLDFSFSGLKTAVLYHVRGVPGKKHRSDIAPLTVNHRRDIAASFQAAAVATIVEKVRRAAKKVRAQSIIVGGGVSANRELRGVLRELDEPIFLPKPAYCTDNAAMSAGLAHVYFQRQDFSELNLDAITYSTFSRR